MISNIFLLRLLMLHVQVHQYHGWVGQPPLNVCQWTGQNSRRCLVCLADPLKCCSKLIKPHFSATALQSLEIAADCILSGKAKVMLAGGYDDLSEEGSYEFAQMKATSNAETEFAMGREPTEMSRPATSTRAGVSRVLKSLQQSANISL